MNEEFAADDPKAAFESVSAERGRLLEAANGKAELAQNLLDGRVLLLLTDLNLKDGSAVEPSGGLIGEFNVPLCDTWIDFLHVSKDGNSEPALACWIPRSLVGFAQRAIDVNPEECLVWGDELSSALFSFK